MRRSIHYVYDTPKKKFVVIGIPIILCIFFLLWTTPRIDTGGTIKIFDRNHELIYEVAGAYGSKQPIPFNRIPKHCVSAIIAAEDSTFWTNPGIDPIAMTRAFRDNILQNKIVSGASTITQQLVRSTEQLSGTRNRGSITQKFRESIQALRLTAGMSKQSIFATYANTVYFGENAFGIQSAAQRYFNADASNLSLSQCALLSALIANPDGRNPIKHPEQAINKRNEILSRMKSNGFISESQYTDATRDRLGLSLQVDKRQAPHVAQYVLEELTHLHIYNRKGISIETTIDIHQTQEAQDIASRTIQKLQEEHNVTNASVLTIDNTTGAIRILLGGIDYTDSTHSGQVNMTAVLRQPGSTLKPIAYAAEFLQDDTPATVLHDVPTVFKTKKGEGYAPQNYDGRFHGLVSIRTALASSLNVPAVISLSKISVPLFIETAKKFGITTFTRTEDYDLSLALGGGEVTLIELTNAYASFARGAVYIPTYIIESIKDDAGKILYLHTSKTKPLPIFGQKSQSIAFLISDILSDQKARIPGFGEKNPLVLSRPAAVKTGTTTDWHDVWTVGYTPDITTGVWVGNNDNQEMKSISGVTGAAPIWHDIMEALVREMPVKQFEVPQGIVSKTVCIPDGLLATPNCPEQKNEYFISGTEPKKTSSIFKTVKIDNRNNLLASDSCPEMYIQKIQLVDFPSDLYSWAVTNKQPYIPHEYSPLCDNKSVAADTISLHITNPRAKTVFELAETGIKNQAIVFEIQTSGNIQNITWIIDDKPMRTVTQFPFSFSFMPPLGNHVVRAETAVSGKQIKTESIPFSVQPYEGLH